MAYEDGSQPPAHVEPVSVRKTGRYHGLGQLQIPHDIPFKWGHPVGFGMVGQMLRGIQQVLGWSVTYTASRSLGGQWQKQDQEARQGEIFST